MNLKRHSAECMDAIANDCDTLYREGLDGFIGIRLTFDE